MDPYNANADGFYTGDDYGYFHWNEEQGHWERWTLNNNEYSYEYAYKIHQDQPGQGANWEIESDSSQIVDAPAHLPLPTFSDLPQQSPQEQPGVLAASPGPLANIGTLEEIIEIAWQKCQEYQSKFFMWYYVTLLCTQSRAQHIFPPVKPIVVGIPISPPGKPIVVEMPISPPVKPTMVELPISPPVKHVMFERPIFPPVKHVMFELPISPVLAQSLPRFEGCQGAQDFLPQPPVKPVVVELPTSPPVKPIVVELPISPKVKPIMVELPISPQVKPIVVELPISPPVKPIVVDRPISPPVKPIVVDRPISPPVKHVMFERPIFPPVKHVMFELPISPVLAQSLPRFEFAPPPQKNKPLKGLTQRQKDMETSVPQARTTLPPICLSDYFPPTQGCQGDHDFFNSPPPQGCQGDHDFFNSPPPQGCQGDQDFFNSPQTQGCQGAQDFFDSPPPQVCQRAQEFFNLPPPQGCQRAQDFFNSPQTQGCQGAQDFFDSPPPQGCQRAQYGVNQYSMRAGAPMSNYPGSTTKAGPGISDAALAHMLRPLSPMCVPEDDGGWDSGWDHMTTPGTPFYMR